MAAHKHRTTKFNTWVNDDNGWLYFFGRHVPPSEQTKSCRDTVNVALNSHQICFQNRAHGELPALGHVDQIFQMLNEQIHSIRLEVFIGQQMW